MASGLTEAVAMVLGPPTWQRVEKAQFLLDSGQVSRVLVSVSPSGRQSAALYPPCEYSRFTCETPAPFTTKGEVAMLRDFLGADAVDQQVVVVTFTPHVARTRYVFQECFGPNVAVLGVSQDMSLFDWMYQYVYQSVAFLKAAITPCVD
ncbi:hypothetical protein [Microbacterium sp.]|uniref:hypothetical protein n=1 Tax=Microbacterium sp. TaxID=51671 RepID=UPI0025CD2FD6|nr:hypothetical protein [Microbacterium sp.]MBT9608033.1 hypothetical protein [Microbacterium sp.]